MKLNQIELKLATLETKHKLENLMSLYLHDLSEFADDLKINENGQFEYNGIDFYFSKEELNPFFICLHDEIVGFVLLNSGKFVPKDVDYSVHEMFILKTFRKKGVAGVVVKKLLEKYKGKYKVVQLLDNETAVRFWRDFYKNEGIEYVESIEIVDEVECFVQRFSV